MPVRPGIQVLLDDIGRLPAGTRIGAVVHPASMLPDLRHTAEALLAEKRIRLVCLFGPQHGARGEKQDNMIESQYYRDPATGLPVHSLYGETREPTEEMLRNVDVLFVDLQDVGTRVYTFIHTMAYCLEACARFGKRIVVADRPNPIGGVEIEGSVLRRGFASFVGLHPLPMRHGMTIGELALLYNTEFAIGSQLEVIPMQGWRRRDWFDETGLPWVMPSPNLPSLDSATVYPGMVLLEGTTASEGRGTTRPFEIAGAPYVDARALAEHLNGLGLPGVRFRAMYFEPTFQKHAGELCGGVQLHVGNRTVFEPVVTGIAVIRALQTLHEASFAWRLPPYEYETEIMPIDILSGGDDLRRLIDGGATVEEIRESWQDDLTRFRNQRQKYLLYD
jgi:uncharacterized protein YbbC (DUF1343 family)